MTTNTKNKIVQSLKIWIAIYPSITLVNIVFGDWLATLPIYFRTFVLTIFLVPWMVFVLLPFINVQLRKFYASKE